MWEGVNLCRLGSIVINVGQASKRVGSVDVHGTGSADSFTAGSAERESWVLFVLDLDQDVQNHGTTIVKINGVRAQVGSLRLFRVPSVNLEILDALRLAGDLRSAIGF